MKSQPEYWAYEPTLVASLPASFRAYALVRRLAVALPAKRIYGAYLFRRLKEWMSRITEGYRGVPEQRYRLVQGPRFKAWIDLGDDRVELVLQELCGHDPTIRRLPMLLAGCDAFIDIGGNHGTFSLHACSIFRSGRRVVTFEPQAALARLISRSFSENGYSNALVLNEAVSDTTGAGQMLIDGTNSGVIGLLPNSELAPEPASLAPVQCTTLEAALDRISISGERWLIKIDVEGHEASVLKGCETMLRNHTPILVCEVNGPAYRRFGFSTSDVVALLQKHGYDIFIDMDNFPEKLSAEKLQSHDKAYNVLILCSGGHAATLKDIERSAAV